ncbi:MAG TPA: hypothetical protein VGO16_02740 [Pseudonocardiaceae bacterium]|jgi:hypothetical protein|nr:hypothetical protein [Pseudonocardiaceae bacterium]
MATPDLHPRHDLGMHPGESDPAVMLGRVLVLLAAIVAMVTPALVWWLS